MAESESPATDSQGLTHVDARAPRFGQTVSMTVLLLAVGLQEPLVILALAVVLDVAVLSGWRVNVYGFAWRHAIRPLVGPPAETEPAPPHRFATLMGAVMSTTATVLLVLAPAVTIPELGLAGYGVALLHAGAAAIGGIGDYCIGCKMYRQVSYCRRLGVV